MREIIFDPYDATDLQTILEIRVRKALRADMIDEGVVPMIAAFSSRNHGDARKAVDLLARSAELAEKQCQRITLDTVEQASEDIERNKYVALIRTGPKHLQAALYAALLGSEKRRKPLQTGDAYLLYEQFCEAVTLNPLTQRAFSDLLNELDMYGFIRARTVSRGRYGRSKDIQVAVAPSVVEELKSTILTHLDLAGPAVTAR
jgi:cell division control protein 6